MKKTRTTTNSNNASASNTSTSANKGNPKRRRRRMTPISRLSYPIVSDISKNAAISSKSSSSTQRTTSSIITSSITSSSSPPSISNSASMSTSPSSYNILHNVNVNPSIQNKKKRRTITTRSSSKSASVSASINIKKCMNNNNNNNNNNQSNYKNNKNNKDNQLWVDKYKPTNIKDLCVATKKIQEVREWLEHFHNSRATSSSTSSSTNSSSKLLILVGSAGIGKSTLIHILAKELKFQISEWNEIHNITGAGAGTGNRTQSQLSSFEEFLSSSALGCNITLGNTNTNTNNGNGNDNDNGDSNGNSNNNNKSSSNSSTSPSNTSYSIGRRRRRRRGTTYTSTKNTSTSPSTSSGSISISNNTTMSREGNNNDNRTLKGNDYKRSLVLIDELPNLHNYENEIRFREIMTKYIQKAQIPTILIFSDVYEGKYRPEDLERIIEPKILSLPQLVKIIQINAVTKAKMKSCISRIIKGEGNMYLSKALLSSSSSSSSSSSRNHYLVEELHSQSDGDLRHAIMTLQFKFGGDVQNKINTNMNGSSNVGQGDLIDSKRDTRLSAFHALGKLLYAKRKDCNIDHFSQIAASSTTSFHNHSWNIDRRPPLEFNPEKVLDESTIGLNNAINFMGYHSPDFFTDITELESAFSRFSDAALFLDKSYGSMNDTSYPLGYATSIIGRSVADANKHPAPSKFRQFHAPKVYEVMRNKRENQSKITHLCKKLSCRLDCLDLKATVWSSSSFSLEYYPLLKSIIPDEVSILSTNLYSNDCFVVTKEYTQNDNHDDETQRFRKEVERQREILALDDIEDSSSDETDIHFNSARSEIVDSQTQESAKSEIIVIDDSD